LDAPIRAVAGELALASCPLGWNFTPLKTLEAQGNPWISAFLERKA
jgi:hypothetical protein